MMTKTMTGVDIDDRRILSVTLQNTKHSYRVLKVKALADCADTDILAESHPINHQATVNKLSKIRKDLPFWNKTIAMTLPETDVIGRFIRIDEMDSHLSNELSLKQIIAKTCPVAITELYLDYAKSEQGFYVLAVKRDVIERLVRQTRKARLALSLVDTEKQAMGHYLLHAMQWSGSPCHMLIDMSGRHIRMICPLAEGFFYRHILCDPLTRVDGVLISEIQRFRSMHHSISLSGIWLTGDRQGSIELAAHLQSQVDVAIDVRSPWEAFDADIVDWSKEYSPVLAIGAALRGLNARRYGFHAV